MKNLHTKMKMIGFLNMILMFSHLSFSQTIEKIESQIDSLIIIQKSLDAQLIKISEQIFKFEQIRLDKIKEEQLSNGVTIFTKKQTSLYKERGTWYDKLATIPASTAILAYDFKSNYYFVEYDTLNGYVIRSDVETSEQKSNRHEKEKKRKQKQTALQNELITKYGSVNGKKIYEGKIWLGMSKEMVIDSWGKPDKINRNVGSWGVNEQWIYGNQYLYLRDDKLSSWQD